MGVYIKGMEIPSNCDKCFHNHILEGKGIPPTEYEEKPKPQKKWLDWLKHEA